MPRKYFRVIGCSLLLVALSAPRDALAQRNPNVVEQGCFPIRIHVPDVTRTDPRRPFETPSFSASTILDLELQIGLPRSTQADTLEVKFFTPEAHLYQTVSVPVSTEVRAAGESRTARRILIVTLPVAGTTIVSSALYGTWTVEAHLDGAETPCAKGLELKIYP